MATTEPRISARQQFAEVLKFHREQRQLAPRRVADMLGVSREAVANFEAGHVVPDGKSWDKYIGIVNRRLRAFAELRQRALTEAAAERDFLTRSMEQRQQMATANGTNGHNKTIGTNLGDKIAAVKPSAEPPRITLKPTAEALQAAEERRAATNRHTAAQDLGVDRGTASDGRRMMPTRPAGSMKLRAIEEREQWARLQFRQRPRMPVQGDDGLLVLMRKRFGIGLDPGVCNRIKAEVHAEFKTLPPSVPHGVESAPAPVKPAPLEVPVQVHVHREIAPPTPKDPSDDITAAVQLILGSVPGLSTFTIKIDEHGEAAVDYTVREVRVVETGGSIRVRR